MSSNLSEAKLEAARESLAGESDPQRLADLLQRYKEHPKLEEAVKARLAEIDGGWLLDELGGLRRPLSPEQMAQASKEFADMETEAIVRELVAEWYFFHPDIMPLADARLAQLSASDPASP